MTSSILHYLESVSTEYPNKIAVSSREEAITFSVLREKARQLGTTLRVRGASGRPIGVFADRSIEAVVRIIAVLYSGGYYIPLDPEMPAEKLASILDDAHPVVLLGGETHRGIADRMGCANHFLTTDDLAEKPCDFPEIEADSPLYVVYTSGSTGKPKGVLKSHAAMENFIETYCRTFSFSAEDVIGNQSPFFFDASAKDIYLMLKTGATMDIIPSDLFAFPPVLIEYLNEHRITFASWVPSAISMVVRLNPFGEAKPLYLKKLFFVGEVMPVKFLNKWREALPDVMYVNLYGQSELAGICCFYPVSKDEKLTTLPIGKPLDNCNVYLLDQENGHLITEPGRVGEIYIASPALATEYYHDPAKTEKAFSSRNFGDGEVRCFKTGDLAQYDTQDNLLFAARNDLQIKHMGHRIELGEIENVANTLPGISRSCCLYQHATHKIILCCEPESGKTLSETEIWDALHPKLSHYMMPSRIVIMQQLPQNQNGKIDRHALEILWNGEN